MHPSHLCLPAHVCAHALSQLNCVLQEALSCGVAPSLLTLRQIGEAMFRPPDVQNGGPSEIDILPVLPNTDTKSYEDLHRTFGHLNEHSEADVKVKLAWVDGQGGISGVHMLCWPRCGARCTRCTRCGARTLRTLHTLHTLYVLVHRKEWEGEVHG